MFQYPPFVIPQYHGNHTVYEGYCMEMLEILATQLNFRYTIQSIDEHTVKLDIFHWKTQGHASTYKSRHSAAYIIRYRSRFAYITSAIY